MLLTDIYFCSLFMEKCTLFNIFPELVILTACVY